MNTAMKTLVFLALLAVAAAECPNACSGHGDCGAFDMCTCWRNWQSNDCSERTCPFGLAHVDTPKGDLDMDNDVDTNTVVAGNSVYYYGTEEQFPLMKTSASNTPLQNTAHWYMECSNKGLCDRGTGMCQCFDGYEGSGCQRASCPNQCSGHGTCESIRELASKDDGNIYELWDRDMTYGCKCDPGYYGADCSARYCKHGVDPLYYDDEATYRVSEWVVAFTGTSAAANDGSFEIEFFDVFGENYVTKTITVGTADTTCVKVVNALEALPNTVVPVGSVSCKVTNAFNVANPLFVLAFTQNPGVLKPINVRKLTGVLTAVAVYPGPQNGEFNDYFYDRCADVTASIDATGADLTKGFGSLLDMSAGSAALLKKCLGDSDGEVATNVEISNWDYGDDNDLVVAGAGGHMIGGYPHVVKLVPVSAANEYEGGLYYTLWYDGAAAKFKVGSALGTPGYKAAGYTGGAIGVGTSFYVYTTTAIAQITYQSDATQSLAGLAETTTVNKFHGLVTNPDLAVMGMTTLGSNVVKTKYDVSCENAADNTPAIRSCLKKGDIVRFQPMAAITSYGANVYTGNMYTITKIWVAPSTATTVAASDTEDRFRIQVDKPLAFTSGTTYATGVRLYKFEIGANTDGTTPAPQTYVDECSNRGNCDSTSGLCQCFKGYTGDACQLQSSFAV